MLALVRGVRGASAPASRTIVGGVSPMAGAMRGGDLSDTVRMDPADLPKPDLMPHSAAPLAGAAGSSPSSRTMLGIAPPVIVRAPISASSNPQVASSRSPVSGGLSPVAPSPSQATLLGVARPGIAPLRPGVQKTPTDQEYEDELGATYHHGQRVEMPPPERIDVLAQRDPRMRRLDRNVRVPAELRRQPKPASKRGLWVLVAAALLAVFAVAFALLWPSAPPLSVQVRAAEGGVEVLDVRCPSCPEGTVLHLGDEEGKVSEKKATIPLKTPLAIGDTPLKIKVDRPGSGRDETVSVIARIAYRIRPDLTMLEADRPAIQIVVEAMGNSKVSLDGEDVPLRDGRAVRTIDVSKDLEGTSQSSDTLVRKVSYTVTPPGGTEEKGMVAVNATVLPLVIDAPGPSIVTDQATFVLAGKTLPGAIISAAGRGLEVAADGTFARRMNVSSVGATQIEVRAKMPGKAPRFAKINVERVASFDAAVTEFMAKKPLGYADFAKAPDSAKGSAVAFEGEIAEVRTQANSSLVVLNAKGSCPAGQTCPVRLSVGFQTALKRDDKLRVFGSLAGAVADGSSSIPSVDVAFLLNSSDAAHPKAGSP